MFKEKSWDNPKVLILDKIILEDKFQVIIGSCMC